VAVAGPPEGFCELALAGGPPHRGTLLEAPLREEVLAPLPARWKSCGSSPAGFARPPARRAPWGNARLDRRRVRERGDGDLAGPRDRGGERHRATRGSRALPAGRSGGFPSRARSRASWPRSPRRTTIGSSTSPRRGLRERLSRLPRPPFALDVPHGAGGAPLAQPARRAPAEPGKSHIRNSGQLTRRQGIRQRPWPGKSV